MNNKNSLIIAIFILFFCVNINAQGYEITIKMKQLAGKTLILGHHFSDAKTLIPDDSAKLDLKGVGVFKKNIPLTGGLYFIFLPTRTYFDIIIDTQQKFTIENDTLDLISNLKITGSSENSVFTDFNKMRVNFGKKAEELQNERKNAEKDPEKVKAIDEKLKKIDEEYKGQVEKTHKENPNSFFSKFLKSTVEIQIPATITKDVDRYYYYRGHYFDNFDISDTRLLRTPIYQAKIDYYIDKVVPQHPDTLIKEVDLLISKSRTSKELFRFMLITLFNKYAASQLMTAENVYVHIAEKYYIPEAEWSDKKFKDELIEKVRRKKNCLVGNNALDIKLQTLFSDTIQILSLRDELTDFKANGLKIEKDTISMTKDQRINAKALLLNEYLGHFKGYISSNKVNARYTVLWFWEPDCSHCKEETPKLYKLYKEKLKAKGVEVITIYLNKDIDDWAKFADHIKHYYDFTIQNKLTDWVNGLNPFDPFRDKYDISSSPVLYLLDKNKKIIAKRIGHEQVLEIIENIDKDEAEMNKK